MKIIVVSNLYPPDFIGGHEILCAKVVEELRRRGHEVIVLTGTENRKAFDYVHNCLFSYRDLLDIAARGKRPNWAKRLAAIWKNRNILKRYCQTFNPDIFFIWNISNFPLRAFAICQQLGIPAAVYLADYWLKNTKEGTGQGSAAYRACMYPFRLLIPVFSFDSILRLFTISHFVREEYIRAGFSPDRIQTVYLGLEKSILTETEPPKTREDGTVRVMWAGQLVRHKGAHVLIEALGKLFAANLPARVSVDIYGAGDVEYRACLEKAIREHKLEGVVSFEGKLSPEEFVKMYQKHDIFVFTSVYPEPFSTVVLQAMAAQLCVIASDAGGSKEAICHGENGLLYPAGSGEALSKALEQVLADPDLRMRISQRARADVLQKFRIEKMVDDIERGLDDLCKKKGARAR